MDGNNWEDKLKDSPYAVTMDMIEKMAPVFEAMDGICTEMSNRGYSRESQESCAVAWFEMLMSKV